MRGLRKVRWLRVLGLVLESILMWCVLGTMLYFALILERLFWQPYVVIVEPNPSILTLEVSILILLVIFMILQVVRSIIHLYEYG